MSRIIAILAVLASVLLAPSVAGAAPRLSDLSAHRQANRLVSNVDVATSIAKRVGYVDSEGNPVDIYTAQGSAQVVEERLSRNAVLVRVQIAVVTEDNQLTALSGRVLVIKRRSSSEVTYIG